MRIFKNRGDIYFSKTNKEKSKEQKLLIFALVFIVLFTIVFMGILAVKNDFSIKEFFKPEDLEIVQEDTEEDVQLPEVSGKTNFITIVNSDDNLLFVALTQVDLDNLSYKSCLLKASTIIDDNSLASIYSKAGAENVELAIETYFNVAFDYYLDMDEKSFASFFDEMGTVNYPISSDIKYKDNSSTVPYSVRLKAGEQSIKGTTFVNLIRYYIDNDSFSLANDLMLNSLLQHINEDNLENSESLFNDFVTSANTNITVRVFSLASDGLMVLSNDRTGVKVYSAEAEYKKNKLTKDSLKNIKGYFVK